MSVDLGTGIAGYTSIGPRFNFASGFLCLANSLARRLLTPRGKLPWAPNDGTDMRDFLNHGNTPQNRFAAGRAAKDECEKDERVQSASVTATFDANAQSLALAISIQTAAGPFALVIALSALGIAQLSVTS